MIRRSIRELPEGFKLEHSYILVNAAECEPGLEHNIQQLEEQTDKVIRGVKYCMEITHADKAIFAIKKKHHKAIKILDAALKNEPDISMHMLADIYPMGEERAVVRECLGVNLTTTQLPSAARSVVVNLETVAKVAEAIDERKPCNHEERDCPRQARGRQRGPRIYGCAGRRQRRRAH